MPRSTQSIKKALETGLFYLYMEATRIELVSKNCPTFLILQFSSQSKYCNKHACELTVYYRCLYRLSGLDSQTLPFRIHLFTHYLSNEEIYIAGAATHVAFLGSECVTSIVSV